MSTMKNNQNHKTNWRYIAAEKYRNDNIWVPDFKNAELELSRDREFMVRINRDQHLNNPIYKSIIDSLVNNIVGPDGAEILWRVDNPLKKTLNDLWMKFTRTADFSNRHSFTELERIIVSELLVVGEVLLIKVRSTQQIQIVETERIEKVVVDEAGNLSYFMISNGSKSKKIPAEDAIFISNQERYSSVRGVGALWSCVDVVNMLSFILRSSAKSMGIAARHTISIEKDDGEAQMYNYSQGLAGYNDPEATPVSDDVNYPEDRKINIEDATMFIGKKGEKLTVQNQNGNPNDKLSDHVLTFCRVISASVGIDAASVVLQDFSKYNYSSSKASNIMLTATIKRWQNKLVYQFYNRIIKWLVGSWMVNTNMPVPNDTDLLNSYEVILPLPQIIDNKGEAESSELEMSLGLALHEDLLLKRNIDRTEFLTQRKEEIITAYKISQEIEVETGLYVPYQHFCGIPIGKTESNSIQNSDDGSTDDTTVEGDNDNE